MSKQIPGTKKQKAKKKRRTGLLTQVYFILVIGMIIAGIVIYSSQYRIAQRDEMQDIQDLVERVTDDTIETVREYSSYQWLLRYWYEHADTLEIDYSSGFGKGSLTEEKCRILSERYPDLQLRYATVSDLQALAPEDQKLSAEILYSWLIDRIDGIKQSYLVDFLYCIVTDTDAGSHPYESQFYLFSGAGKGAVRGTGYGEVYPLGKVVSAADNPELQKAMRNAVESARLQNPGARRLPTLDQSGNYVDGYAFLGWIGNQAVLIGTSFNIKEMNAEVNERARDGTGIALLYQLLLLHLIMLFLFLYVIRPLEKVLASIRNFTENKKSSEVRTTLEKALAGHTGTTIRHNEIGQLARDFIGLTEEMDDHVKRIETVTAENERIEVELHMAADIQEQTLPPSHPEFPKSAGIDLYATMDPAKEVGGDFYDYFMVDEDHLALVMADVSGKGVPASLFMMIAKALIQSHLRNGDSPKETLYNVNRQLCDGNRTGFFVTVWLAVIELSTGKGIAANAGHEHPALARKNEPFQLVTYRHSPAVALMEGIPYKEHEFQLYPGDRIFVYTDGVPEAVNTKEQMFGTDRMLETLNRDPDAPPEELLHRLRREIDDFSEGTDQFDDITMMCLWYRRDEDQ